MSKPAISPGAESVRPPDEVPTFGTSTPPEVAEEILVALRLLTRSVDTSNPQLGLLLERSLVKTSLRVCPGGMRYYAGLHIHPHYAREAHGGQLMFALYLSGDRTPRYFQGEGELIKLAESHGAPFVRSMFMRALAAFKATLEDHESDDVEPAR
jgi:hypothetical protein